MNFAVPILADPKRSFGPREPRIAAAARSWDCRNHLAGLRINLLDAILGDLEQVPAVEGGSCVRADLDRAHLLPVRRVEGVQRVARSKPYLLTVVRDSSHVVDTEKGAIFADDFGR